MPPHDFLTGEAVTACHTASEVRLNPNNKLARIIVVVAAFAGCARPALSTHKTENPSIPYEMLFTRNGCEIGRFIDFGRPVYVTLCPAQGVSASQSSWIEKCGKDCYQTVDRHQMQIRGNPPAPAATDAAPSEPTPTP